MYRGITFRSKKDTRTTLYLNIPGSGEEIRLIAVRVFKSEITIWD